MFPLNWNIPFIRKNGSRTTLGAIIGDIAGIEEDIDTLQSDVSGISDKIVTTGSTALSNSGTDYELIEGFIYKKNGVNILSVAVKCVTPSPATGGNHIKFSELPSGFSKPPVIIYSTLPCYRDGTTNEGAQLQIATNGDLRIRGGEAGARYSGLFAF